MAGQKVNDMPRTDPEAAREVAVKHLFRHLRDDQQLNIRGRDLVRRATVEAWALLI
jgi:hypothetical protein